MAWLALQRSKRRNRALHQRRRLNEIAGSKVNCEIPECSQRTRPDDGRLLLEVGHACQSWAVAASADVVLNFAFVVDVAVAQGWT